MKPDFVEMLVCPKCHRSLRPPGGPDPGADIQSGELKCTEGHTFPIVGGIPRFVDSELYVQNFGFEWNVHADTQLDNSASDESERTFRSKTGFTPELLRGKRVLGPNVHIAQANVFELPFEDGTFDFIFSIGVLHHTPNTKAAFDNLPKLLRDKGKIAIWLYTSYGGIQWRFSDLYRRVTPRLPQRVLHTVSYASVPLYYVYKVPILGFFLRWVLPVSNHPKRQWRVLDTFDWYSPRYQWKHTYEEVFPWFEEHGLTDIRVLGVPVAVQGTKRPEAHPIAAPTESTATTITQ